MKVLRYVEQKGDLGITLTEMSKAFQSIKKFTDITKYKDFQYRLLINKIFCNDVLVHWKKVDSNECDFCGIKQSPIHLFWDCKVSQKLYRILRLNFEELGIACEFNVCSVILNNVHASPRHIGNFLVLITKQFIYRCKCYNIKPKIEDVFKEIDLLHNIEFFNAIQAKRLTKHYQHWRPVHPKYDMYIKPKMIR